MKSVRQYNDTKNAWIYNYNLAKNGQFVHNIIDQLSRVQVCEYVRIHGAGDFFSADYVLNWGKIIKAYPNFRFYGYTKTFDIFPHEIQYLNSFDNCNIINSIADDGGLNYGDWNRINDLMKMGYFLCPAHNKNIKCGRECKYCITQKRVCFLIH